MDEVAEFTSLRQELLQCQNTIVNVSIFVITATGASISAAFQFLNPLAALFPLLVLYLGYKIVYNNIQTMALIGSYSRVFWEKEHQQFHWENRQAKRRTIAREEVPNRLGQYSANREEWTGPVVYKMIFAMGIFCILMFAYVSYVAVSDPKVRDLIPSLPENTNLCISFGLSGVLSIIWVVTWIVSRPLSNVIYGKNNTMEQLGSAWQQVKDEEEISRSIKGRKSNKPRIKSNQRP